MTDTSHLSTAHNSPALSQKQVSREIVSQAISYILNDIITENEKDENNKDAKDQETKKDIFCGTKPPSISIHNFIKRFIKYTNLEKSTLIMSLIFLDRYTELTQIKINILNIHRLLITSIITAIKFNEDDYFENSYYAKIGGISAKECNFLELGYVKGVEYNLYVPEDVYEKYDKYLSKFSELDD